MNGNIAQFSLSFPFLLWYNAHKATPQHMHGPAGHQRGLTYSRLGGIVSWKIIVPAASCWPVSSLPGPYGIGSLGGPSRRFVDFLAEAGQPLLADPAPCPTGGRLLPYMSPPLLPATPISRPDELAAEGLLTPQELDGAAGPTGPGGLRPSGPDPYPPLQKAWERSKPPTSSLTPQTCPGWRITAPSPPSTTGIKPLSGSGRGRPSAGARRRLIFTVSSRRPSTASGWL